MSDAPAPDPAPDPNAAKPAGVRPVDVDIEDDIEFDLGEDLPTVLAELACLDEEARRQRVHEVIRSLGGAAEVVRQAYRDAIAAAGYIGARDWTAALAEAKQRHRNRQRQTRLSTAPWTPESRYIADPDGCLYLVDEHGPVLLARFIPLVVADITRDDGAEKTTIVRMRVTLPSGRAGEVDVAADRLHKAREWAARAVGANAVIMPASRDEAHVLTAAQVLGDDRWETIVQYAHTGWRQLAGRWQFLTTSGALGADGLDETVRVDLGNPTLNGYRLPDPAAVEVDQLRAAVVASLDLRFLAPAAVMAPLLGAAYRAALPLLPDTSVFAAGQSGSLKTAVSALMCQHFGPALDAKGIPAEWKSTANALEVIAHALANVLLVIDDYAPQAADDPRKLAAAADRVLRGAANSSDRGRLRPDGTPRPARPPRAQILTTGEDIPPGESLRARLTVTEITRGDVHQDRLTEAQKRAAEGVYALATAGYVRWLAEQLDADPGYPASLRGLAADLRHKLAADGRHLRVPEATASLLTGWTTWLRYATTIGAVTAAVADQILADMFSAMIELAGRQTLHTREFSPAELYIHALAAAITGGHAHLAAQRTGLAPPDAINWGWRAEPAGIGFDDRPRGICIGHISDDGDIFLDGGAAFAVAREHATRAGTPLAITKTTMKKRLYEAGYLASTDLDHEDAKDKHIEVVKRVLGRGKRVLHLNPGLLTGAPSPDLPETTL